MPADELAVALALRAEIASLDRVEVRAPDGTTFVLEYRDEPGREIALYRAGALIAELWSREAADDLRSEQLRPEELDDAEGELVADAVVTRTIRVIHLRTALAESVERLRAAGDTRPEARALIAGTPPPRR